MAIPGGRRGARSIASAAVSAALVFSPAFARADQVLVFQQQNGDTAPTGGDLASGEAAGYLQGLGHEVTTIASLAPTMPTDLGAFDAVWVIQVGPIPGVAQSPLIDFVKQGGGLYLTGEREPCCSGLNSSVQNIHNLLAPTITNFQNQLESGDDFVRGTDTFGISRTPNDLPTFLGGQAGTIAGDLPLRNQVYQTAAGDKLVMGAWPGEDLTKAGGCLLINMDLTFWFDSVHPEQDRPKLVANLQRFLSTCNDRDGDGASDPGEATAGTDPDDPDSDDDGLCDGYGTVAGTCIAGESGKVDSDRDGLIDPEDPDDDNDTLPTSFEVTAELANPIADGDTKPAWLDVDSDDNNIPDRVEGFADFDHDGIPAIVQLSDSPENCDTDEDCEIHGPPFLCNQEEGFCMDPGASSGGAGGASGAGGAASGGGAGGANVGGGGGGPEPGSGGEGNGGRASGSAGGNPGSGAAASSGGEGPDGGDTSGATAGDTGGCGCSVPGRSARTEPLLALLAAAALARRRLGGAPSGSARRGNSATFRAPLRAAGREAMYSESLNVTGERLGASLGIATRRNPLATLRGREGNCPHVPSSES